MDRENRPRIRWKTLSLRGLLLLVLAIAVWLGWIVNQARQQREAVAALQKFGGFVHYDWEFVDGPVNVPPGNLIWKPSWGTFTPGGKPWAPDWLRKLAGDEYFQSIAHVSLFVDIKKQVADARWVNIGSADDALRKLATQKGVRTLHLGGEQVTDENLSYVGQMTGLEELSIMWGRHLTDRGLVHLSGLSRLRILEVDHSKMTDLGLKALGKLTSLEELRVGGEGFSDRGLEHLAGLKRLKHLTFWRGNQRFTDAGLEFVRRMKSLEQIDMGGWDVTDQGVAKLRELTNLKTVTIGLPQDQQDRRNTLQSLLPGIKIE
jgi:hypothetical protein